MTPMRSNHSKANLCLRTTWILIEKRRGPMFAWTIQVEHELIESGYKQNTKEKKANSKLGMRWSWQRRWMFWSWQMLCTRTRPTNLDLRPWECAIETRQCSRTMWKQDCSRHRYWDCCCCGLRWCKAWSNCSHWRATRSDSSPRRPRVLCWDSLAWSVCALEECWMVCSSSTRPW